MIVVIVCNAIKTLSMFLTVFTSCKSEKPLVTVGDAIVSFLTGEDMTTLDMCTVTKGEINKGAWGLVTAAGVCSPLESRLWRSYKVRWFRAAGKWRWVICSSLAILTIATTLFFLSIGLYTLGASGVPCDLPSLWGIGLGKVDSSMLFDIGSTSIMSNILLANTPQVTFSTLYLLYNSLFTSMLLASEWDRFSLKHRGLRVTSLAGEQRSTYFLNLPYKFSVPLMVVSGVVHWLISQGLFLVRVNLYSSASLVDSINIIGYSPIGVILTLALGS